MPGPSGLARPSAPADAATLRKLKEDLLQQDKKKQKKGMVRTAAGTKWFDPSLAEWPENDHRIFVGDLGNEVNDELLGKTFSKYPSFAKAKVSRVLAMSVWYRSGGCLAHGARAKGLGLLRAVG